LPVEVVAVKTEAKGIKSFTFQSATDQALPKFSAGAHIQVHLPSGKKRSYSLVNAPFEKGHYQIAVKLDPNSSGGSKELHETIEAGMHLEISVPRNNFVLYEHVQKYILIAGGIGITPLLSMAHRLTQLDRSFELHICSKSEDEIPFAFELTNWTFAPNVEIHLDKQGRSSMELDKVLAKVDQDTLIYVCGPAGFNHWVKQSALEIGWSKEQIKQEVFSREGMELAPVNAFELNLQKSGKSITVSEDQTIIDALQMNNIKVPYSCMQGTCGSCVQAVVSGEIDHRDAFLSEDEKKAGTQMCLCVSRAKGERITLDL
ncbi:MAG: PDR/VanB family oxidoreductase, partial [Bacteroidota bacterium]